MDISGGGQAASGRRDDEPPWTTSRSRRVWSAGGRARSQFHSFCEVMIVREDDMRQDAARQAEDRIAGGVYGKGAVEEVTVPRTDVESQIQRDDPFDPAKERIDPQVLRDGGPVGGQGAVTTTGGTAGPASVRRVARQPERHPGTVAPTTTGDATTGGLSTPMGGGTSDQSTSATAPAKSIRDKSND